MDTKDGQKEVVSISEWDAILPFGAGRRVHFTGHLQIAVARTAPHCNLSTEFLLREVSALRARWTHGSLTRKYE